MKAASSEMNAVRVMIITTSFFALSWLPADLYFMVNAITDTVPTLPITYAALFLAFVNNCANPFIYIFGYDDVRVYLVEKVNWLLPPRYRRAVNHPIVISVSERFNTATTTALSHRNEMSSVADRLELGDRFRQT